MPASSGRSASRTIKIVLELETAQAQAQAQTLIGRLREVSTTVLMVTAAFNQTVEAYKNLVSLLSGDVWAKLAAAVDTFISALEKIPTLGQILYAGWQKVVEVFERVRSTIANMSTTVKVAVVAIGALVAAAYLASRAFRALKDSADAVVTGIQNAFGRLGAAVIPTILGIGAAVAGVTAYFAHGVREAIAWGAEMQRGANRAQVGAKEYAILSKALESAGLNAKQAGQRIREVVERGGEFKELFASPQDYERAIKGAAAALGSQADTLARAGAAFNAVNNMLGEVATKTGEFFVALAEQVLPVLQVVLQMIMDIDLAGAGERFGKALRTAAETLIGLFKTDLRTVLGLALTIAAKETVNVLVRGIAGAAYGLRGAAVAAADAIGTALKAGGFFLLARVHEAGEILARALGKNVPGLGSFIYDNKAQDLFKELQGGNLAGDILDAFQRGAEETKDIKLFPTDAEVDALAKIIIEAHKVGAEEVRRQLAKLPDWIKNPPKISPAAMGVDRQPREIIADSLARVGGSVSSRSFSVNLSMQQLAERQLRVQQEIAGYLKKQTQQQNYRVGGVVGVFGP